ncbi:MAG: hypothetical protein JWQ74_3646, partial [Marmoricola sp.]|nr:hypothetical protein [Marmoricola sp.]
MTTALQTPETTALDPRAARTLQALNDALFTLLR